jgi:hypothetical protein
MSQTTSFFDLRDVLAQPGCPVCRLRARDTERFLESLLWEQVNDPDTRQQIRQARGFCPEHTRQLAGRQASLGIAILTQDVLHSLLDVLEDTRWQAAPRLSLKRALEALDRSRPTVGAAELVARLAPQRSCLVCQQANTMETIYLDTLLDRLLEEGGLLPAFQASDGLCLPHLRLILARGRDRAVCEALVSAQAASWKRLDADLIEFIRKNDYRFREEPWGQERDAWRRAAAALGGSRAPEGE